jgi:putative transposase
MEDLRDVGVKPSRFTEEQIIGILREKDVGAKTADACRKHASTASAAPQSTN